MGQSGQRSGISFAVGQRGDRGGLAEWEQIHGKKKAKVCLGIKTGLLRKGSKQGMLGDD